MRTEEVDRLRVRFDDYAHTDGDGVEYWLARDIMRPLGYAQWRRFEEAIQRAIVSCETAKVPVESHFAKVGKMVELGSGTHREVNDYRLTRYACYLIAQNGDVRKPEIALAQAYFATKTRESEVIGQRVMELQRLSARHLLSETETHFAGLAFERGVDAKGFARIQSRGDQALFGGKDTRAMKRKLGVPERRPLADSLSALVLNAKNLATSMTTYNIEANDLQGQSQIEVEHVANNRSVRDTLMERGIRPEALPPEEDTKKVERRVKADERKLSRGEDGFRSREEGGGR